MRIIFDSRRQQKCLPIYERINRGEAATVSSEADGAQRRDISFAIATASLTIGTSIWIVVLTKVVAATFTARRRMDRFLCHLAP